MLQCSTSVSLLNIFSLNLIPTVKLWKWKAVACHFRLQDEKEKWVGAEFQWWWWECEPILLGEEIVCISYDCIQLQVRENPPKRGLNKELVQCLKVIMEDPGSFYLTALLVWPQSSWWHGSCSPADILPMFQERKKGRKKGQMHESVLFWKAVLEAPSSDFCPGRVTWSRLAARESGKETISVGHIASLNKIRVLSLRRAQKMAIG